MLPLSRSCLVRLLHIRRAPSEGALVDDALGQVGEAEVFGGGAGGDDAAGVEREEVGVVGGSRSLEVEEATASTGVSNTHLSAQEPSCKAGASRGARMGLTPAALTAR